MAPDPFSIFCNGAGRSRFRRLLCAAFLFASTFAANALRFDVFPGYGDVLPEGNWFPIVCEIRNDGPSFSGAVEISPATFGQNQVRRVPLELPNGTTKRVLIPVFSTSPNASWTCRLLDGKRRVRAESVIDPRQQRLKQPARGTTIIGALARTIAGVPAFPSIKSRQSELQPVAGRLQLALFPDNPIALEGADIVYLSSQLGLELGVNQVNAVLTWLHAGGHLVIGLDQISDIGGAPWLRSLLPGDFTANSSVKVRQELQDWIARSPAPLAGSSPPRSRRPRSPTTQASAERSAYTDVANDPDFEQADLPVATGTLRDGKVIASAGEIPLVIEAGRGRGRLTVLTFSPEREPFVSWKNRAWFWARLANLPGALFESGDFNRLGGYSIDSVFGAMIDSKQVRKLPLGWLVLLLFLYLLVIGPVDQFCLKKLRRPMLTWITFPCYVLFFSVLIYYIGFQLRAGDSEYNELHVVDALPNGAGALLRGRTYSSIYSPVNATYPLKAEQPFATLRGEFLPNYGRGEDAGQATIVHHGNNFDADVFVPVWTSQLYVSDWIQPAAMPLTLTISPGGPQRQVAVQNHLDEKLTDVHLCLDGKVFQLGEVPAQQTKTFTIAESTGTALRDFVRAHGAQFQYVVERRRSTFGSDQGDHLPNIAMATMAASFVSELSEGPDSSRRIMAPAGVDLTRLAEGGYAILLAFAPGQSLTTPFNRFTARRGQRNTLLRVVLPPAR